MRDVHVEVIFGDEQHAEGFRDSDKPQDGRHCENAMHIPAHRFGIQPGIVGGDGHDWHIIKERQQDDHDGGDGIKIENQHGQHDEDHNADGFDDTVNRIAVHALEDAACLLNSADDDIQARCHQHQSGRSPGGIHGAGHCDTHVRLLERRGIVDAIAGHTHQIAIGFVMP